MQQLDGELLQMTALFRQWAVGVQAHVRARPNKVPTIMPTREGVDSIDVIVRPYSGAGWQIELPQPQGAFVVVVIDQTQALWLAKRIRPEAQVRLLPIDSRG